MSKLILWTCWISLLRPIKKRMKMKAAIAQSKSRPSRNHALKRDYRETRCVSCYPVKFGFPDALIRSKEEKKSSDGCAKKRRGRKSAPILQSRMSITFWSANAIVTPSAYETKQGRENCKADRGRRRNQERAPNTTAAIQGVATAGKTSTAWWPWV